MHWVEFFLMENFLNFFSRNCSTITIFVDAITNPIALLLLDITNFVGCQILKCKFGFENIIKVEQWVRSIGCTKRKNEISNKVAYMCLLEMIQCNSCT